MSEALLAGGKMVWQLVSNLLASHDQAKAHLLSAHVEPLQQRMQTIHADYTKAFRELQAGLERNEITTGSMVAWIEARRLDLHFERNLARQLASQLAIAERRAVRPDAWTGIVAYCKAIDRYLASPYQYRAGSRLSGLILDARRHAEQELRRLLETASSDHSDPAPIDFLVLVNDALHIELPASIEEVNQAYARLRVLLT